MLTKLSLRVVLSILFACAAFVARGAYAAGQGKLGEVFPIDMSSLCGQTQSKDVHPLKLVVFEPAYQSYQVALSGQSKGYQRMMRSALYHYFVERHAFDSKPLKDGQKIHVFFVSGQLRPEAKSEAALKINAVTGDNFLAGRECRIPSAASESLAKTIASLGVTLPKADNASATLFLLDENNVIHWRDDDYRAQGEHLKPLERKIKALFGAPDALTSAATERQLKVGDLAPNFRINDKQSLSDLKGKTVLLTFYPAAFSGTDDPAMPFIDAKAAGERRMAKRLEMISCVGQIREVGRRPASDSKAQQSEKRMVERLAISSSTQRLLALWEQEVQADEMRYVNDLDYAVSQRYSSYDYARGYNLRTVFIVDASGKIAFVDWDFTYQNAAAVTEALARISGSADRFTAAVR